MNDSVNRLCKIVATLGPASDGPDRIRALANIGVDMFRLNFSHGSHEEHKKRLSHVRQAETLSGKMLPVLADMQGPKLRVGALKDGQINLKYGAEVQLICAEKTTEKNTIPIPHRELFSALKPGDDIMLDDGLVQLTLIAGTGTSAQVKVSVPGVLTDKKGINIPGRQLDIPALTKKDRKDLAFALECGVDYIALSFVQCAQDVKEARTLINGKAGIISKIEKPSALEELEEIIQLSDAIMVARGDLGVELPLEQVPVAQRRIIRLARRHGKPVIVATQMLQSMVTSATPTRAEASDTASAVYLGADAVMLSAESAVGKHPEAVVAIMARIIEAVEGDEFYWDDIYSALGPAKADSSGAISLSARHTVDLLGCKAILACTTTGATAFAISRERPRAPIIGITPNPATARRINLAWGVLAVVSPDYATFLELDQQASKIARQHAHLTTGDTVLLTAGIPMGQKGGTNTMKVIELKKP